MGERRKDALRVSCEREVKLEFHGTTAASDAGLIAYRDLDETLGLTAMVDDVLRDHRRGKNTQRGLADLVRQSVYDRLVLPASAKHLRMTTMREKLIKNGAKVVRHSKYVFFQTAEVAVPEKLFAAMRIAA